MNPAPLACLPLPLAALSEYPTTLESIRYQVTGLAVVFIALGLIWVMMEILGAFFRRLAASQAAAKAAAQAAAAALLPPPPPPAPVPTGPSPATVAVIIAAVHCTLGHRPHRIISVSPAEPHDWSREGRRDIFSSHRVR